ncbi:MAG: HlyD family efflux transporter periplasmic adaptor subunit [Pseudomonadota bacterium]
MDSPLFRPQAQDANFEKNELAKQSGFAMPFGWALITGLCLVGLATGLSFALFVSIPRYASIQGVLSYADAEAKIYPQRQGFAETCVAEIGSTVEKGAIMATVSTEVFLEHGRALSTVEKNQALLRIDNLQRQIELARESKVAAEEKVVSDYNRSLRTRTGLEAKLAIQEERLGALNERLAEAEDNLAEGLVPRSAVYAQRDAISEATTALLNLQLDFETVNNEIANHPAEIAALNLDLQTTLKALELQLIEAQNMTQEPDSRSGYALTAPFNGTVAMTRCRQGALVEEDEAIFLIAPEASELIGEGQIGPDFAASLAPGQQVRLTYLSIDSDAADRFYGKIVNVTATDDVLTTDRFSGRHYKVEISIESPSSLELIAGMEFVAKAKISSKTIFQMMRQ